MCAYQGVRNISFLKFAYLLNKLTLTDCNIHIHDDHLSHFSPVLRLIETSHLFCRGFYMKR